MIDQSLKCLAGCVCWVPILIPTNPLGLNSSFVRLEGLIIRGGDNGEINSLWCLEELMIDLAIDSHIVLCCLDGNGYTCTCIDDSYWKLLFWDPDF